MNIYCTTSIVETTQANSLWSRSLHSSSKVKGKDIKCQGVVLLPVSERRAG